MKTFWKTGIIIAVPLVLLLAACGGDEEAAAPAAPEATRVIAAPPPPETAAKVPDTPVPTKESPPQLEGDEYGGKLRFVPNGGVYGVDPIRGGGAMGLTTAYTLHDWLIAWDSDGNLQPQMLDSWKIEDDGKLITLTLRDGLLFHNLEPVTPADIIQSIHRWRSKAVFGGFFNEHLESLTSPDDKTIVAKFYEPSGVFIQGLGDPSSPSPIMVPEYLAKTPKTEVMPEQIGAGVYKLDSWDEGHKTVWSRFKEYNPRSEPASFRAGGKHGYIDVVEAYEIPEAQTRVAALLAGEIDFLDVIPPDFIDEIEADPGVTALISIPGAQYFVGLNMWEGAFAMTEKGLLMRKAVQAAVNADEIMELFGPSDMWTTCASMWACGTRYANTTVENGAYNQNNPTKAKELLKEAGYNNEPVILTASTGWGESRTAFATVLNEQLKNAGFNVDFKMMDAAAAKAYTDQTGDSGWNISATYMTSWSWRPIASRYSTYDLHGYDSPAMTAARLALTKEADGAKMQDLAAKMQEIYWSEVPYVLVGHAYFLRAMNSNLEDYIDMPIDGVYLAEIKWKKGKQQ
jgi:peptide/nickel transport system substrate-binding protein